MTSKIKAHDPMDLATTTTAEPETSLVVPREYTPSGIEGEIDSADFSLCYLSLCQKSGALADDFKPGNFVFAKSIDLGTSITVIPVRAAKFYEVTKQLVLTAHLVDSLFIAVSNKLWNGLNPTQKLNLKAAAVSAAQFNNDNRLREEAQIIDYFRQQGLAVTTPDLTAFRLKVQQAYMGSDYAKQWPSGILERINAVR